MSDKTTAALAAEQADVEATTTQEPELLPAATLDELEQVDLGTVAEGERAPFRITDDRCADWAIRKIADERSEYDRLKALADEQIAAINEKVAAARKRMENGTSYLTSCLADFFATVPHKETKTTEKYRLLSGTLTFKKGTTKTKLDETKLVPWLKANGYGELVKVEESTRWADLKKLLSYTGDIATLTETGEIVEGVTVYETPGIFTVDVYEKEKAEREVAEAAAAKAEEEKKMRERIKRIVGESGMGDRFLRRTFSTFQLTDDNKRAAAAARRYAEGFDAMLPQPGRQEPGRNGLFIAGPPGTGKTHLAAAIANHLIAQGKPVICMTMIDLLERIKRTYSTTGGSESDVLKIYKTVPLLVIDDIGKEPPTEWAISTVYNIINGRYEAYLPTIVTTNYDTEALIDRMTPRESRDNMTARATIDRLMEMCRGITLTGQSWRSR